MLGNFIADSVKGKQLEKFNSEIQKGIILHRHIDFFTDNHPIVKQSKKRLHPRYRHYAGVIIDIFYDHFLALNWNDYSNTPLNEFTKNVYIFLTKNINILPEKTKQMLPYMIKYNWLYNYQFIEGIKNVLEGMNRRTENKSKMNLAINDLQEHHKVFQDDFRVFFIELQDFSKQNL